MDHAELFAAAQRVIPGGVNSPVRAFGSVGGTPCFVAAGHGSRITDEQGRVYVDLVQSYGAVICGHAHPAVTDAISRTAARGTSYGAPTVAETRLAEAVCAAYPGVEKVRLVNSGTEATMTAVRLARGCTGRPRIVKFAGCYHGHSDLLLAAGGSGVATLGLSGAAGVPDSAVADTIVAPYNVVPEVDDSVAAVIVEPVAANMGLVLPQDGFLEGLRAACTRAGALLVFDEVITGFRLGRAGAAGRFGVVPDIACFGKVIGGGLPIGALGGPASIMDQLAPLGPVYQAGTLSGNPLATAAGLAVLDLLDDAAYTYLEARAAQLADGLNEVFRSVADSSAPPATAVRCGTLVGLYFGPSPQSDGAPCDYETACATDEAAYAAFFHAMLERGVALAPGAYEALFVGLAHRTDDIDAILEAADAAVASDDFAAAMAYSALAD